MPAGGESEMAHRAAVPDTEDPGVMISMFKEVYKELSGNSLRVQWSALQASTAGGQGSTAGQDTKIPQARQCGQK